jgi:hypothetical protein
MLVGCFAGLFHLFSTLLCMINKSCVNAISGRVEEFIQCLREFNSWFIPIQCSVPNSQKLLHLFYPTPFSITDSIFS